MADITPHNSSEVPETGEVPVNKEETASEGVASVEQPAPPKSREALFGSLLLGAMVIFLLLIAAGIAWAVWGGVNHTQTERQELSIATLGEVAQEVVEEAKEALTPEASETAPTAETPTASVNKATAVSVLNGGAAGGSAGKLATAIKGDGYTNVLAGDTTGDYTGVVIYYAESAAKDAEALKAIVAKTYPAVTVAKAMATNAETSKSPLTVIIGR